MKTIVSEAIAQRATEIADTASVVRDVGSIQDPPCSAAFLDQVRVILLRSRGVKDVAYQADGKLLCSSSLGSRAQSIPPLAHPDFVAPNGWRLWVSAELAQAPGVKAMVLNADHVVVARLPNIDPPAMLGRRHQLSIVRIGPMGSVVTGNGPVVGLSETALRAGKPIITSERMLVSACTGWLCYVLSMRWSDVALAHASTLAAAAAGGALLGIIGAALVQYWITRHASMDRALRRAMQRRELELHYQPIIDTSTGTCVSAEALMRWFRKDGSQVDTSEFIEVAEAGGFAIDLFLLAVRLASQDLSTFLRFNRNFKVSLNITANDLLEPQLFQILHEYFELRGIHPNQIALELTERRIVDTAAQADSIRKLREAGYLIHIDDFGTGYSNLSYLSDLSVDCIKIDRSFTRHVTDGSSQSRIVPPMLEIARELGLAVIVEGVETEEQRLYFADRNVKRMQGWLFAAPMPAEALLPLAGRQIWAPPRAQDLPATT
ncbi:EAL domain-containing protein [Kaistia algarum]|uniref:EAL domain-containing protein n=1 Tax=Kaistia algarum TaxID=2083279 RepID=UPI0022580B59|nr:EAL domain-containing protein [Kaistia algarum]MCX5512673.1 EAL domain-containing protein [Kaistia algarum]